MLKNLYVKPKYRGRSLGKLINEARINNIPESYIPCVFVLPENRYAIRNLKMYAFEECLKVSHITWFKTIKKTKIKKLKNNKTAQLLLNGFRNE